MGKVLVTGSSGLVGNSVITALKMKKMDIVAHSRSSYLPDCENVHVDLTADANWEPYLKGVDTIIHCAARVHQMNETVQEKQNAYHAVNVDGSLNLAKQAVEAGVKRFIFISSIKVNGEWTQESIPFTAKDAPHPQDDYGKSKFEAEKMLTSFANSSGLDLVIIRPPLVYGPGVKANFLSMMKAVVKGLPLPLGLINSLRSMVFVENLVDLIMVCCEHPDAPGKTFLVSDDEDISIRDLLRTLANSAGKRTYLLPIPQLLLVFTLTLLGKKAAAQRLCKPLQLDIQETKDTLGWKPKFSLREGLAKTMDYYLSNLKSQHKN